jgi:hypothetical protein
MARVFDREMPRHRFFHGDPPEFDMDDNGDGAQPADPDEAEGRQPETAAHLGTLVEPKAPKDVQCPGRKRQISA